jgi:hypothetical protein
LLHVVCCKLSLLHADSCVLSGLEVHLRLELRVPHLCHAGAERLRHIAPLVGARLGARGPALRDRTVVAVGAGGRLDKPSKHTNTHTHGANKRTTACRPGGSGPLGRAPGRHRPCGRPARSRASATSAGQRRPVTYSGQRSAAAGLWRATGGRRLARPQASGRVTAGWWVM